MTEIASDDRQLFEELGEVRVRAEVARGGDFAFDGNSVKRKAASEWLAEREQRRADQWGGDRRSTIAGPVVAAVMVIALFVFVAAL